MRIDDLTAGMAVTVYETREPGKKLAFRFPGGDPEIALMIAGPAAAPDRSFHGDVLIIKSVLLPFIAALDISFPTLSGLPMPLSLDTRRYRLMPLTRDYCDAILGAEWKKKAAKSLNGLRLAFADEGDRT